MDLWLQCKTTDHTDQTDANPLKRTHMTTMQRTKGKAGERRRRGITVALADV